MGADALGARRGLVHHQGPSIAEIAALRQTSEGTVKAHSNAIYRKAG